MNDLIKFLSKFYFFILFLFLQIICLSIVFSNNGMSYQQNAFFSLSNNGIAWFNKKTNSFTEYFDLRDENDKLAEENKRLRESQGSSFKAIEGDLFLKNDTVWKRQYRFLTANVISGTLYQDKNYFTLDRGSEDGVVNKRGVISADGIVGRVVAVSDHYSVVESVISETFSTGAYIPRTGHLGFLKWNKDPEFTELTEVVVSAPIAIGDQVMSKDGSGYFPPDTPIGEIAELEENEGEPYYDITLKLKTDFTKLKRVYIVSNEYQEELIELQNEINP